MSLLMVRSDLCWAKVCKSVAECLAMPLSDPGTPDTPTHTTSHHAAAGTHRSSFAPPPPTVGRICDHCNSFFEGLSEEDREWCAKLEAVNIVCRPSDGQHCTANDMTFCSMDIPPSLPPPPPPPPSPPSSPPKKVPPLPPPPPRAPPGSWSYEQCMGTLITSGLTLPGSSTGGSDRLELARNTGGGTASCCAQHPVAAPARVLGSSIQVGLLPLEDSKASRNGGRVYLSDACEEGAPSATNYAGLKLLGNTLSVTVDLSGALCGCNVAFYLGYLRGSPAAGRCDNDWYCEYVDAAGLEPRVAPILAVSLPATPCRAADRPTFESRRWHSANEVCGTRCAEIDIMEANVFAFHSALHEATDNAGEVNGIGGSAELDGILPGEYGPGSPKIDTRSPFRLHAFFKADAHTKEFASMKVSLEQEERLVTFSVSPGVWQSAQINTLGSVHSSMTEALKQGMTPIFSYWSAGYMGWLDSGPCDEESEDQSQCGEVATFSDLALCEDDQLCAFTAPARWTSASRSHSFDQSLPPWPNGESTEGPEAIDAEEVSLRAAPVRAQAVTLPREDGPSVRCGVPGCTAAVLNTPTPPANTCGGRMDWLVDEAGLAEHRACEAIAVDEYPNECGRCASAEALAAAGIVLPERAPRAVAHEPPPRAVPLASSYATAPARLPSAAAATATRPKAPSHHVFLPPTVSTPDDAYARGMNPYAALLNRQTATAAHHGNSIIGVIPALVESALPAPVDPETVEMEHAADAADAAAAEAAATQARAESRIQELVTLRSRLEAEELTMEQEERQMEDAIEEERATDRLEAEADRSSSHQRSSTYGEPERAAASWVLPAAAMLLTPLLTLVGCVVRVARLRAGCEPALLHLPASFGAASSPGALTSGFSSCRHQRHHSLPTVEFLEHAGVGVTVGRSSEWQIPWQREPDGYATARPDVYSPEGLYEPAWGAVQQQEVLHPQSASDAPCDNDAIGTCGRLATVWDSPAVV